MAIGYFIVGLGNPGEKYEESRHNVGFLVVETLQSKSKGFSDWEHSKKTSAEVSEGVVHSQKVLLVKPQTYMNKSGTAVRKYVTSKKKAEKLIVVHDDVDLPFGVLKISVGRGSGGHRGVASIIRTLDTKEFIRVRVGVVPTTPSGKLKKPRGEQKVLDHLMGEFSAKEEKALPKILKQAASAVEMVVTDGTRAAMNQFN